MTHDEVVKQVKMILTNHSTVSNPEQIKDEDRMYEDLGMDSLDSVETMMDLEEHFNIEIPDEQLEGLNTVSELITYIDKKLKEK